MFTISVLDSFANEIASFPIRLLQNCGYRCLPIRGRPAATLRNVQGGKPPLLCGILCGGIDAQYFSSRGVGKHFFLRASVIRT